MLHLGIEVRDFDLDRLGFSLSVLDENGEARTSESYLRMTLPELDAFLRAMRGTQEIDVVSFQASEIRQSAPQKVANLREVKIAEAEATG